MEETKKKPKVPDSSYLRTYQHLDEADKEEMDRILSGDSEEQKSSDKLDFKPFIGCKVVKAAPMDELTFIKTYRERDVDPNQETRPGYIIIYPDNYVSWSPQFTFDTAYRLVTLEEAELILDSIASILPKLPGQYITVEKIELSREDK